MIDCPFEELPANLVEFLDPLTQYLCRSRSTENYRDASVPYKNVYLRKTGNYQVTVYRNGRLEHLCYVTDSRVGGIIVAAIMLDTSLSGTTSSIYDWFAGIVLNGATAWISRSKDAAKRMFPSLRFLKDSNGYKRKRCRESTDDPVASEVEQVIKCARRGVPFPAETTWSSAGVPPTTEATEDGDATAEFESERSDDDISSADFSRERGAHERIRAACKGLIIPFHASSSTAVVPCLSGLPLE